MENKYALFEVGQNIVLLDPDGKALIVRHKSGKWLLPGGRINEGESWRSALEREVSEEVGVKHFEILGILCVDSWKSGDTAHYGVFMKGRLDEVRINPSNEIIECAWVDDNDLDRYDFWFAGLKDIIRLAWK